MLEDGEPVLVALSGGADSVALLRALQALAYPVRAFHLNHCLRGAESDRDEAFCRALCAGLGVPLTVERIDVAAARAAGEGIEAAARRIRYARLTAAAQGAKIATAHTADDNLETMLFHLVRGTGPKGLAGIPPVRGQVIRPLLGVTRAAVEAYLHALGQDYVTDSTNADDAYTRNRIRHEVVPVLRQINPAVSGAAARLARCCGRMRTVLPVWRRIAWRRRRSRTARGASRRCGQRIRRCARGRCAASPRRAACRCGTFPPSMWRRSCSCWKAATRPLPARCRTALRRGGNMTLFGWKSRKTRQKGRCVRSPSRLTGLCGRGGCTSR